MDQQKYATPSSMSSTSLESHTPFEMPEEVIAPAFSELIHRSHRVRTSDKPPYQEFLDDERVLFNYDVAQRRRVLQHAFVLIFG